MTAQSNIYQVYEAKLDALFRKNGILEGQLTAALAGREAAEKNLLSSLKSRQEMEKQLADITKELEFFKEKLNSVELAHEEANSLSNIVHSDNVRLEHNVAFLKAVLDDTQKELHSTRGVLAVRANQGFESNRLEAAILDLNVDDSTGLKKQKYSYHWDKVAAKKNLSMDKKIST